MLTGWARAPLMTTFNDCDSIYWLSGTLDYLRLQTLYCTGRTLVICLYAHLITGHVGEEELHEVSLDILQGLGDLQRRQLLRLSPDTLWVLQVWLLQPHHLIKHVLDN